MSELLRNSAAEREAERVRRRADVQTARRETPTALHPILRLQKQVGNAQVSRLVAQRQIALQRESEGAEGEEEELQAKHDLALQRESEGGEGEEEELQAKHDPALQRESEGGEAEEEELQAKHDLALQRESEGGEAEEEELQAKHDPQIGLEGGPVGSDMAGRINGMRGSGSTLGEGVRSKMEGAIGESFADVRVHRDSESDALNRSMTAKAFTTGSDIFLREDQSPGDERLMAHELTHVVQQRSMAGSGGGMNVGAADDSHEHEADQVAESVLSGAAQRKRAEEQA